MDPPADELIVDQADQKPRSVYLLRGCYSPRVAGLDLLACAGATAEVAHHLEVGVELDLPLECSSASGIRVIRSVSRVCWGMGSRPGYARARRPQLRVRRACRGLYGHATGKTSAASAALLQADGMPLGSARDGLRHHAAAAVWCCGLAVMGVSGSRMTELARCGTTPHGASTAFRLPD